jgi:CubicO group peptidase (beta-lactamase class C family)
LTVNFRNSLRHDIAVPYNFGIWPWVYLEEVTKGIPYNNDDSAYGLHGFEHFSAPGYPSSGLRASVNDVARFLAAIMNGGELDGVRVLDESTIAAMFEPQFSGLEKDDFEVDEQALFWTYNDGLLGHSGGDLGANPRSVSIFTVKSRYPQGQTCAYG